METNTNEVAVIKQHRGVAGCDLRRNRQTNCNGQSLPARPRGGGGRNAATRTLRRGDRRELLLSPWKRKGKGRLDDDYRRPLYPLGRDCRRRLGQPPHRHPHRRQRRQDGDRGGRGSRPAKRTWPAASRWLARYRTSTGRPTPTTCR